MSHPSVLTGVVSVVVGEEGEVGSLKMNLAALPPLIMELVGHEKKLN